jgi:hypothetical protein
LIIAGRLSYHLGQLQLSSLLAWPLALPLLAESTLLVILSAALTRMGQDTLVERYGLQGWRWFSVLLEKYSLAAVRASIAWLGVWILWLGIYWSGLATLLGSTGRQLVWVAALLAVTLAAHIGAHHGLRYSLSSLRNRSDSNPKQETQLLQLALALVMLFFGPMIPLFLLFSLVFPFPNLAAIGDWLYLLVVVLLLLAIFADLSLRKGTAEP